MQRDLFYRDGYKNKRIDPSQILYIAASRNYTRIIGITGSPMVTLIALKRWSAALPEESFCQIHRGFIVSIPHIQSFDNNFVYLRETQLPIGHQYLDALRNRVTIIGETPRKRVLQSEDLA